MGVVVIANPRATATSNRQRRVVLDALANAYPPGDVQLSLTTERGHASMLAEQAMRTGADVVVAMGGDGTVNEVVNGLLSHGVRPDLPRLGIIPVGSTNVFARALGLPGDPVESAAVLLEALTARRSRAVTVGRADQRWFLFSAGLGFDAAVVARVEQARRLGRKSTHALYVRTALQQYARDMTRRPLIELVRADGTHEDRLHFVLITNTNPWTYLGRRPVTPTPGATLDNGLSIYGRRSMAPWSVAHGLGQLLRTKATAPGRAVLLEEDLARFSLRSPVPLPFQVDGDYVGDRDDVTFEAAEKVLSIAC